MFTILLAVVGLVALGMLIYSWVQEKEPLFVSVFANLKNWVKGSLSPGLRRFGKTVVTPSHWLTTPTTGQMGLKNSVIERVDEAMPWVTVVAAAIMFLGFAIGAVIVSF